MMAEDHLRMGIVRVQNMDPPDPYKEEINKRILVVGGGVTGMTSALEAARAGYEVVLVEREASLGGFATKLYKQYPKKPPYREMESPGHESLIQKLREESKVKVYQSAAIEKISGSPGMFDASIRQDGKVVTERVGAIVLATGFEPYDPAKLEHLGFGKSPNVITTVTMEEMASKGSFTRPSDGQTAKSVAFILCAGSRDPNHLPYCSTVCCMTALKQAIYVREKNPEAKVYIFYKDIRTPGQYEDFYRRVQEDEGIFLTKGEVTTVSGNGDGSAIVEVDDTLLGEKIRVRADLVVLATGMVPRTALGEEASDGHLLRKGIKKEGDKTERHCLPAPDSHQDHQVQYAEPGLPPGARTSRPEIRFSRFPFHLLPLRDPPDGDLRRRAGATAHGHGFQHGRCPGGRLEGDPVRGVDLAGEGRTSPSRRHGLSRAFHATVHPVQTVHRGVPFRDV